MTDWLFMAVYPLTIIGVIVGLNYDRSRWSGYWPGRGPHL